VAVLSSYLISSFAISYLFVKYHQGNIIYFLLVGYKPFSSYKDARELIEDLSEGTPPDLPRRYETSDDPLVHCISRYDEAMSS